MARVLFYTGASLLAVSAALLYLPTYFSFLITILLLILLIFLIIFRKRIRVNGLKFLVCVVLLFTILGIYTHQFKIKPAEIPVGYMAEITGTVCDYPTVYENYSVYIIETEKITLIKEDRALPSDKIPQKLKLRLSDINKIGAEVFDKLRLTIRFNDLDIYRNSSLANKIYAGGYIESLKEHLGKNRPFYAVFYDLRSAINSLLYENVYYDDAAVVSAVLLGDRNNLNPNFERDAKVAGISHMLVVSGLHLGIIFQLLNKIFSTIKMRRRIAELFMLGAIFSMTAICGFTPSILRAALTYVIIVVGSLIFKKPDALNSLGLATIILLFINPLGFGNISLLLSLLSTFGLLFICPILQNFILSVVSKFISPGRITKIIVFSFSQTLSATLATLPVCILAIGYISLVAPLTNLLTGYASTLLMIFSFITVVILCMPSFFKIFVTVPLAILYAIIRYIVWVTNFCADIEMASLPAINEYLISLGILLLSIPAILLAKRFYNKNKVRISLKITASALVLISVSSAFFFYSISPKREIVVPDLGDGTCVLIKTENNVLAIGAGDSVLDYNKIENHLLKMCSHEIDYVIIPTAHENIATGASQMIFKNPNAKVIYPNNGDYTNNFDYISRRNFQVFDYKADLNLNDATAVTYADIGTTVNFNEFSVIVYTGNGDITTLFKACKHKTPILICTANPNQNLEYEISDCIISGSDDVKSEVSKLFKTQEIKLIFVNSKTVSIKF